MSLRTFLLAFATVLLLPNALHAQTGAEKDKVAMAVLTQMGLTTGWVKGRIPADIDAEGTLVRAAGDKEVSSAIHLKARVIGQFRSELRDSAGTRSTVVNGSRAVDVDSSRQSRKMAPHVAVSVRPVMFPFFLSLRDIDQPDLTVYYAGTEEISGQAAHRIEISQELAGDDALSDALRRTSPIILWISTTSFLPLQMDYIRLATSNRRAELHFVRKLGDYRLVNGMLVPFLQEEWVEGQLMSTLKLTTVRFNVGLSDSDFPIQ